MPTRGDAPSFVDKWSRVWRGRDSDPDLYMVNPPSAGMREDLPSIVAALLAIEPDVRVVPTRWAETADGVLIEWVNTGTLGGAPFELRGADRFTLRDGKASEGYSYFDPRPFLQAPAAPTDH